MIATAISYIRNALNNYFATPANVVVIGNIAFAKDNNADSAFMEKSVVLSLINIEEDRISKEPLPYRYDGDIILQQQPAVHLNLYLLFSVNHDDYETALNYLTKVITFFQHKYYFSPDNTNDLPAGIEQLIFDLYSISLDQVHHVWSVLGGKYFPSVIYKLRMVTIMEPERTPAGIIKKVRTQNNLI